MFLCHCFNTPSFHPKDYTDTRGQQHRTATALRVTTVDTPLPVTIQDNLRTQWIVRPNDVSTLCWIHIYIALKAVCVWWWWWWWWWWRLGEVYRWKYKILCCLTTYLHACMHHLIFSGYPVTVEIMGKCLNTQAHYINFRTKLNDFCPPPCNRLCNIAEAGYFMGTKYRQ